MVRFLQEILENNLAGLECNNFAKENTDKGLYQVGKLQGQCSVVRSILNLTTELDKFEIIDGKVTPKVMVKS